MATHLSPHSPLQSLPFHGESLHLNVHTLRWAVPVGRTLFAVIFIISGVRHFSAQTIDYATAQGVPFAHFLVPASGILAILGGLSLALGYYTRIGAALLVAYLIPVTLSMHAFWKIADPNAAQLQLTMFLKNLSMLGGALCFLYFGSGPLGWDTRESDVTPHVPARIDPYANV